jgi:hypothetical protein
MRCLQPLLWQRVERYWIADVGFDAESAHDLPGAIDYSRRHATSAAAWLPAIGELQLGRMDLGRTADSIGAADTDSHTPFVGIVVPKNDNV